MQSHKRRKRQAQCDLCRNIIPAGDKAIRFYSSVFCSEACKNEARAQRPQLPWGMGSAVFRGDNWWATYRDVEGRIRYESTDTDDRDEAERIIAEWALPRARLMVATLERIARGESDQSNGEAGGSPAKPRSTRRDRGKATSDTRARKSPQATPGGQN
jgi:hypothetical protein